MQIRHYWLPRWSIDRAIWCLEQVLRRFIVKLTAGLIGSTVCFSNGVAAINELPSTTGSVVIDGSLDDKAWQDATKIELPYENNPGENLPARVKTVAYLMEDGENLYIGFEAHDPDPSAIRAYLRDRDAAYNDDFVGIIIDTYNDGRRAFEFFANPLGVQMDMTNNEASTGNHGKEDDSWDAIWDSVGQINDTGYAVEMKIPLTQLRFPARAGKQVWGIDLTRTYPRETRYRFSSSTLVRGVNCYLCQIGKITGLENAKPGRDIEIVPTVTASKADSSDDPGFEPMLSGDTDTDVGVSMRWGITPDLTANLAINPDFSQIEADVLQLDVNNRFALFFSEKRPFFLEGADYFTTPIKAVFTRTIASPDVGTKLTGKRGDHTFGLIAAQDAVTNLILPYRYESDTATLEQSNTAYIGRYSYGFDNTSSIGGLFTMRDGDGYHNRVAGIDGRWKYGDQHTVSFQHLFSETLYPEDVSLEFDQPSDEFSGNSSLVRYDFDSRNWEGKLRHARLSDGFRADSGFQRRTGVYRQSAGLSRLWHGKDGGWWHRIRLRTEYEILRDDDDAFAERELEMRLGIGGPMQSWVQVQVSKGAERDGDQIFDIESIGFYTEFQPRGGISISVFGQFGESVDYANHRLGDQKVLEPVIDWNVNRYLLLSIQSVFMELDTKEGEEIFDARVVDARFTWQFSVRSFVRLSWQHAATSRNPDVYIDEIDAESRTDGRQLLYSYKLNPQTVFFLGYSDQYVNDDDLSSLTISDRSVFMKIGYAWNL